MVWYWGYLAWFSTGAALHGAALRLPCMVQYWGYLAWVTLHRGPIVHAQQCAHRLGKGNASGAEGSEKGSSTRGGAEADASVHRDPLAVTVAPRCAAVIAAGGGTQAACGSEVASAVDGACNEIRDGGREYSGSK